MGGKPAWKRMEEPLQKMAAVLKKYEGPFVLGHTGNYIYLLACGSVETANV